MQNALDKMGLVSAKYRLKLSSSDKSNIRGIRQNLENKLNSLSSTYTSLDSNPDDIADAMLNTSSKENAYIMSQILEFIEIMSEIIEKQNEEDS